MVVAAGDICGSGFNPRKQGKVCDLHTNVVSTDALITYWDQLPAEHRQMLFSLPRHDFETELDSCCSCAPLPTSTVSDDPSSLPFPACQTKLSNARGGAIQCDGLLAFIL